MKIPSNRRICPFRCPCKEIEMLLLLRFANHGHVFPWLKGAERRISCLLRTLKQTLVCMILVPTILACIDIPCIPAAWRREVERIWTQDSNTDLLDKRLVFVFPFCNACFSSCLFRKLSTTTIPSVPSCHSSSKTMRLWRCLESLESR